MTRYVVINSHAASEKPRQHVLDSLAACPPPLPPVVVIIGASSPPGTDRSTTDNCRYIHVPYNAIDFTALIAVAEDPSFDDDDEILYMHDTCVVTPHFAETSISIPMDNSQSRRLSVPSCNMGLYTVGLLREHAERLSRYRQVQDLQELKAICVRDEDLIFRLDPTNTQYGRGITRISEPIPYYSETLRRIEEYGDVGLHKIKANWYCKDIYTLTP
jgi:hypothetical protein